MLIAHPALRAIELFKSFFFPLSLQLPFIETAPVNVYYSQINFILSLVHINGIRLLVILAMEKKLWATSITLKKI